MYPESTRLITGTEATRVQLKPETYIEWSIALSILIDALNVRLLLEWNQCSHWEDWHIYYEDWNISEVFLATLSP